MIRNYLAACMLLLLAAAGGCRRSDVELVPVSGYVALDGQAPSAGGTIYFAPLEAHSGQPLRPATAHFAADGFYRASSFDDGDGLVPGRYRVSLHCWQVHPTVGGPPAVSHVPARYLAAGTSQLELVVESGARSAEWNAALTSR